MFLTDTPSNTELAWSSRQPVREQAIVLSASLVKADQI